MSETDNTNLDEIIKKVRNEFEEYENQREMCLSFWAHFGKIPGIRVWPEPVVRPLNGDPKFPDLLMNQKDWLILDYKEISTKAQDTLNRHLADMSEYQQTFKLGHNTFEPNDVAIICPTNAANAFKPIVNTIPILGSKLGKKIKLKHIAGTFRSTELGNMFLNEIAIDLATKLNFYKFLRHDRKCLSYTVNVVAMNLWPLDQTPGSPEIKVTRKELLKTMSGILVPYLKSPKTDESNVEQISSGRLDSALKFLEDIDFIKIKKAERGKEGDDLIITSRKKGPQVNDFKEYFIKKEAEQRLKKLEKTKEEEKRALQKKLEKEEKERNKLGVSEPLEKWLGKVFKKTDKTATKAAS